MRDLWLGRSLTCKARLTLAVITCCRCIYVHVPAAANDKSKRGMIREMKKKVNLSLQGEGKLPAELHARVNAL